MVVLRWLQNYYHGAKSRKGGWVPGLSSRLFLLTIVFILIAEAMIFIPSAANFRTGYLNSRVEMAQTAVLALEAAPQRRVSDTLSTQLLLNARIVAVAAGSERGREIILSPSMEISGEMRLVDLREETWLDQLFGGVGVLLDQKTNFLRIVQSPRFEGEFIEVVIDINAFRESLWAYSFRLLYLSLFVSTFVGILVYIVLVLTVVRPIRRITKSIEGFRDDPRDTQTRIHPTTRSDEIGRAQNTLSDMEATVKASFRERERMAQLGEAMAKINHDLRNSLSSAQIVSDGLSMSEDPRVQRAVPRLERALERAIKLAEDTLQFGRSEPPKPNISSIRLRECVDEAISEGLILNTSDVNCINEIPVDLKAKCDADQLHRILVNLIRNAVQAIDGEDDRKEAGRIFISAEQSGDKIHVMIADNGPGIPPRVIETLFKPFSPSRKNGGSGLGLAIARELAQGMNSSLDFVTTGPEGTRFELILPAG